MTTNRGVGSWGEVLGDNTVAAAMLDRLLHRSVVLNLDGDSYRLRDHNARAEKLRRTRRYAGDGTWDRVLMALLATADTEGRLDWTVSVDATINRAHQHATNTTRPDQDTGGWVELHESAAGRV
jgi:hypothetical protein